MCNSMIDTSTLNCKCNEETNDIEDFPKTRNVGYITVHPDLVKSLFNMPLDHNIIGAEWNWAANAIDFYIEGPDMPDAPYGERAKQLSPSVESEKIDGEMKYIWHWNI